MLLPFSALAQTSAPLSPEAQELIKKGILAAQQQDYLLAIRFFQDARKLAPKAPEIYYDLGLAESKIPGRELRAIAWFGAYLAADPNAANAAAVKDQIDALDVKSQSNISRLIQTLQDAAIKVPVGDPNAWPVPETYHHDAALTRVAGICAQFGDFDAARTVSGLMVMKNGGTYDLRHTVDEAVVWAHKEFAKDKADIGDIAGAQKDAQVLPAKAFDEVGVSIAKAQARAGDIPGAFKTADSIRDKDRKNWALGAIADAQTKAGDFTSALKTMELNPGASSNYTLLAIAQGQTKTGDIAGALKTASMISNADNSDSAYSSIAEAQAGEADTAHALKTVDLMHDELLKGFRLRDIAEAQAKAGDIPGAKNTLSRIVVVDDYVSGNKSAAQVAIAKDQVVAGDIAGARETLAAAQRTADLIHDKDRKSGILGAIAGAHASNGDISQAFKTVDSIESAEYKKWAFGNIAEAQARAGDVASALKTAQLPQDTHDKQVVLSFIAAGQARAGDMAGAKNTADSIQEASQKSQALRFIVDAQLEARHITDALKTAELIQDAEIKDSLERRIAAVQAETVSRNNPRRAASAALPRVSARDTDRIQASDWLKKLDDGDKTDDCALSTRPFLDLAGYLNSLPPSDDMLTIFNNLADVVSKTVRAHHDVDKMLKQQARN